MMRNAGRLMCVAGWVGLVATLLGVGVIRGQVSLPSLGLRSAPEVMQRIYQGGVPHTDRQGRSRLVYEDGISFLTLGLWGQPLGGPLNESWGRVYPEWEQLRESGFNTVWPWYSVSLEEGMRDARAAGIQLIHMGEIEPDLLSRFGGDPHLLGNVWMDEPIIHLGSVDMDSLFGAFVHYRERAREIAPNLNVFVNDAAWITPTARKWWLRWNTAGDVSVHDNYPVMLVRGQLPRSLGKEPSGIPQSVSLAVRANEESKPVWFTVGAFESPGPSDYPFRLPTPAQLRASVYAAIVHGATGITYFIHDSFISRDGNVIGMAENPSREYVSGVPGGEALTATPATPLQLIQSRALWSAALQINRELHSLTPAILSPTAPDADQCTVRVDGGGVTSVPLRAILKTDPAGGQVLLTVNLDDTVLNAEFSCPRSMTGLEVLFESQPSDPTVAGEGRFAVRYEPYEVHIFRLGHRSSSE
jgi:hypothetical protein